MTKTRLHKKTVHSSPPKVSLVLLDWSVRESFHGLYWLLRQNVPREIFEIIWVELYDRIVPEVLEHTDTHLTCGQTGMYHKHAGYNAGLLEANGEIITICDSDAVFPPNFVQSVITSFPVKEQGNAGSKVLMHYEWRTKATYPLGLTDVEGVKRFKWEDLWPNVGACMSVLKADAVRFGGFDEHKSFRGYFCGPYELGWRLINAGIPETWHDNSVALWHFAHPDPPASFGQPFSWKLFKEIAYPHLDGHALKAVEAFSTGRLLPLVENPEIHALRMKQRQIGTVFEEQYSRATGEHGFSALNWLNLYLFMLVLEPFRPVLKRLLKWSETWLGVARSAKIKQTWYALQHRKR
jgi:hypothetical protein